MSNNNMYDILGKLKAVSDTAALTPDNVLTESAQPKGKLAETIEKLEAQYAEIKESNINDNSSQLKFKVGDKVRYFSKPGARLMLGVVTVADIRSGTPYYCVKNQQGKSEEFGLPEKNITLVEGRIDDLRDKQADKDDWFSDKKDKESNKRTVQGKNYGGSKAKDDEEKDDLDESINIDTLARIATGRSGKQSEVDALTTAGYIKPAKDGWLDLTTSGRKYLISNNYKYEPRSGWVKSLDESIWDKPEGTKEKSSTGGTTEKTKTGVKHTAKKYGGETDKDAKEQDLDEARWTAKDDTLALKVRDIASKFFGSPYSSARIGGGSVYRMSFTIGDLLSQSYRYTTKDKISPEDKQELVSIRDQFLEAVQQNGIDPSLVDVKYHIGAGMYASVRVKLGQNVNTDLEMQTNEDSNLDASEIRLVYKLAKEGGLVLEPGDITAAKRVGNEIWTVGPDRNEDTWLLAIFNIKHKDFNGVPEGEFATEEEALQALQQATNVQESAAPGQEDWIKSNKANFIKQYGKKKGLEVLYATAWKRSGKDESVNESTNIKLGKKMLNESRIEEAESTFKHIIQRFPAEVKTFKNGGELDQDLYHALFDYYFNAGEMPYGTAKARTGDPMEWVCNRFEQDLGIEEGASIAPAVQAPVSSLESQLDEIARLAGIDRPAAPLIDETDTGNDPDESIIQGIIAGNVDFYDAMQDNTPTGRYLQGLYDDAAREYRLHPDDQFEEIIDRAISWLEHDWANPADVDQLADYDANIDAEFDGDQLADYDRNALSEDININISATGEDDALNLVRKLAGMQTIEKEPVVGPAEPEIEVSEERDIEYTNTPNERIAPVDAAIPSGTDLNRSKQQDPRTANKAANPLAVKEAKETNKLWHKYSDMLKGLLK